MNKIYIASDHAGFSCKSEVILFLKENFLNFEVIDLGPDSQERVDYPDFADMVCKKITDDDHSFGFLICGSGQGMAIRANKFKNIRAALSWDEESAKLARAHNHANVLCVGARLIEAEEIKKICRTFLTTSAEEGRHIQRVNKLSKPTC